MLVAFLFMSFGCGSFGLTVANDPPDGRIGISPAQEVDFGTKLPEEQAGMAVFSLMAQTEDDAGGVEEVWVEGDTGAFGIIGVPDVPRTLQGKERIHVKVRFSPPESGSFAADFVVLTAGGNEVRRSLVGKGCTTRESNRRCD